MLRPDQVQGVGRPAASAVMKVGAQQQPPRRNQSDPETGGHLAGENRVESDQRSEGAGAPDHLEPPTLPGPEHAERLAVKLNAHETEPRSQRPARTERSAAGSGAPSDKIIDQGACSAAERVFSPGAVRTRPQRRGRRRKKVDEHGEEQPASRPRISSVRAGRWGAGRSS